MSQETVTPRKFRGTETQLFVVALIAPLLLYDLGLSCSKLALRYDTVAMPSPSPWLVAPVLVLYSMLGDAAFALFCAMLLLVRRQGSALWFCVAGFLQICAFHVGLINTASYAYFLQTLDGLDAPLLRHMLLQPGDLRLVLAGEVTVFQWLCLALVFVVAMIAPWLVWARARKRPIPPYPGPERRSRKLAWTLFAASGAVALIGMVHPPPGVKDVALARAPVLNIAVTTLSPYQVDPSVDQVVAEARVFEPGNLTIERIAEGPLRNLVIIVLESTRARSTTPYTPTLPTTPFLATIAASSLVVGRSSSATSLSTLITITTGSPATAYGTSRPMATTISTAT